MGGGERVGVIVVYDIPAISDVLLVGPPRSILWLLDGFSKGMSYSLPITYVEMVTHYFFRKLTTA